MSFEKPEWLWLALIVPPLVIFSIRSLTGLGPVRRLIALVVRSLVVLAVAVILAEVQRVRRNENLTVMFLMDRSLSVRDYADAQEAYTEAVCRNIPPHDNVGVIDFARQAYLEQLPMRGGYYLERGRLPEIPNPERTDVAAAVRLAMAMFPHDTAKRIVLMSDGNDNMGDLLAEARRASADGVVIDVVPLWYRLRNEVYFDKMVAPATAESGEIVPIRMNIHFSFSGVARDANRRATGRLDIYHNQVKVPLPPELARVTLDSGNNSFVLKLPIHTDGVQRFEARFVPDSPDMDTTPDNNRATAFSFVSGKGKVAIMTMNPAHDQVLIDALKSENVKTALLDVSQDIPDFAGMLDYAAVILANVPANVFTDDQQRMLASYVEDAGGGLIMTGGDESFGAGGWIGTPVADVLPVELEIKHKRVIPRGALVLIMHSCELPRGNMWGKLVAKKSVDTISSRDYIGALAYAAGGESWEVPLQLATNKTAIKNMIDRMAIGDMPDFDATMRLALTSLEQTDAAQKHVIIISDGDAQPPSGAVIDGFVKAKITCSTIAIGYGIHVQEKTLRNIAQKTGGRFYPVRNPRTLPQIFVKESKVIRRPLLIDDPFQPQVAYALSDLFSFSGVAGDTLEGPSIPTLGGLVLTSSKPLAITPLVRATTDGQDPVLAHWQRGLGRVVAFTSGYWPVWGTQWTSWPQFAKFWAQTVRWTMRQEAPANFDTYTTVQGNRGRVVVEALDKNADYLNFLNLQAKLIHPTKGAIDMQFTQTGPGHYEAHFDVDHSGQYIAN
ncbi:MAG: VWA domain-containing protein, partial [Phycisphaerae bacterium]